MAADLVRSDDVGGAELGDLLSGANQDDGDGKSAVATCIFFGDYRCASG